MPRVPFFVLAAAVAAALGACSPRPPEAASSPGGAPLPADVVAQGSQVYEQTCAQCHYDGNGSPTAPSLVTSGNLKASAANVITGILKGRQGEVVINGQKINGVMPAQNTLSDADIAAVVTFVRHQFGHVDQLATPAEVQALR